MFGLSPENGLNPTQVAQLHRIEQKLDLIIKYLNLEYTVASDLSEEVRRLADSGRKIEAIKAYREATGAGLATAKEAVEAYMDSRG